MAQEIRPTEPHETQAEYDTTTAPDPSSWAGPVVNNERCPAEWSETATGRTSARQIRSDYMTPSELASYAHGVQLTYGTAGTRPGASLFPRPTEPHPEQLDPAAWSDPAEWLPAGFPDDVLNMAETEYDMAGYGRVPDAWRGPSYHYENEAGFGLEQTAAGFMTFGELYIWQLYNAAAEDPEDPEDPESLLAELTEHTLRYAGMTATEQLSTVVREHVELVTYQVYGYTRGQGFTDEMVPDKPLRAVIVSATARSFPNPTGSGQVKLGSVTANPGIYAGWTLPELAILHNYRRRQA